MMFSVSKHFSVLFKHFSDPRSLKCLKRTLKCEVTNLYNIKLSDEDGIDVYFVSKRDIYGIYKLTTKINDSSFLTLKCLIYC